MKKIAVMAILAAAMLAGAQTASAENMNNTEIQLFKKGKTETKTVTFRTTIHCENCAKKVKENISFEKGVKGLEVSVDDKMVKVTYDPSKITVEKLKAALKKLGYDAEVIA